jgi:cytochrome c556
MRLFLDLVSKLQEAADEANLDETIQVIESLRTAKKSCHKKYRWKEG